MTLRARFTLLLAAGALLFAASLHAAPPKTRRAHLPSPPPSLTYQTIVGEGARVEFTLGVARSVHFGFIPLRLSIHNTEPRDLTWQLETVSTSYSSDLRQSRFVATLTAPGGRDTERSIYIPVAEPGALVRGPAYSQLVCTLSGPGIGERSVTFQLNTQPNSTVPWAASMSLEGEVRSQIAVLQSEAAPGRPLIDALNLTVLDPALFPIDWRGWSPFARVLVRASEYAALAPAPRAALRDWVALGGCLYLIPAHAQSRSSERLGAGLIISLPLPTGHRAPPNGVEPYELPSLLQGSLAAPSGDLSFANTPLAAKLPPIRPLGDWLVWFFVGFAVVIAPVNLFAFAPARRRHRLFLTVPALSLVAVVTLVVAIVIQDGVGATGVRRALVVLLPGGNRAAVFQDQLADSGLLLRREFPLADDTLCAALPGERSGPVTNDPLTRSAGRASGDWFRSRERQGQHLRRITPTRARIELVGSATDGAPIVQSSVGATLHDFYYVDAAGATWNAATLPPGVRTTLVKTSPTPTLVSRAGVAATEASPHFAQLVRASLGGASASPNERFLASADDSDLAPLPTLAAIRWTDTKVLLTGFVEHPASAAASPASP